MSRPIPPKPAWARPIEVELVTPELAAAWLATNFENRRVQLNKMKQYAGAMERGEWELNAECIKFDEDGNLIDGQHRLDAIIASDQPLWLYVARGLPRKVKETVDLGSKRSVSDIMSMRGYGNTKQLAATVKLVMQYEIQNMSNPRSVFTEAQQISFFEEHLDIIDCVKGASLVSKDREINNTAVAAAYYIFTKVEPDANLMFMEKLRFGANLAAKDPILGLINRITKEKGERRLETHVWLAFCIKTWNRWRSGETKNFLIYRGDENFPRAV